MKLDIENLLKIPKSEEMSVLLCNSIKFTVCTTTRNIKNTLPSVQCLQNNYCSKPPENNEVNVKKPLTPLKPLTLKHRRSLNPSARILTMLPPEDQEKVKQSESKIEQNPDQISVPKVKPKKKRNMLRTLGDMPRVMSMLDREKS